MTIMVIRGILSLLNLASLIFWIIVMIKYFKVVSAIRGVIYIILGIITCSIFTFIWGWVRHKQANLKKIMLAWTGAWVLSIALIAVASGLGISGMFPVNDHYYKTGRPPAIWHQRSVHRRVKGRVHRPEKRLAKRPIKRPAQKIVQKQTTKEPVKTAVETKAPAKPPEQNKPGKSIDFAQEMHKVNAQIKSNDKDPNAFYNRGWLYEYKGDIPMAEKDYSRAIAIDKNDVDALYNRGLLFAKQRKYNKAIQDFSAVIRVNPRSADALCNRGSAYFQSGKPELAIEDYDAALRLDPKDADLYYNRAIVYLARGEKSRATADFHRAAELGNKQARRHLGLPPA